VRARELEKGLNIKTFGDLIHHYPFRYIDRTRFYSVREIDPDLAFIQIRGEVRDMKIIGAGSRKQRMVVLFADPTGSVDLVFFKGIRWIRDKIKLNTEYIVFGKPALFNGRINLVHPEIDLPDDQSLRGSAGLQAVYSTTESLRDKGFTQKVFSRLIAQALTRIEGHVLETLTPAMLRQLKLMPLSLALEEIHFPRNLKNLQAAQTRLKFEELFFIQLGLLKQRAVRLRAEDGLRFSTVGAAFNNCYKKLPFELTGAQKRVIKEIRADLGSGRQMNRLLQGDVGSGKTLVAHFKKLGELLAPAGFRVGRLQGSMTRKNKQQTCQKLARHELDLVVGTHALIQEGVEFANLGLVVVDEQHKFGVMQRTVLRQKGRNPDLLVMTATPIPRTLALTLYGELEVSRLDQMPPGRQPIRSESVRFQQRQRIYEEIRREVAQGRQAYIVCPLIDENQSLEATAAVEEAQLLRTRIFPEFSVGLLHGRMKAAEKDEVMEGFRQGRLHILISTTVIEVGVDVPNATIMLVQDANRFGLAQLHQLRGRVGRGSHASRCIFMGDATSPQTHRRLQAIARLSDGFEVAEEDLQIRGPGDFYGVRQAGFPELKVADLLRDTDLLDLAREAAREVLAGDPRLEAPEHLVLRQHFADLEARTAEMVH